MKIRLLTVGKTDTDWIRTGIAVYRDRLNHYINFSITELPDIRNTASLSKDQIKSREGDLILKSLGPGDHVILMDEKGREFTSSEWASWIGNKLAHLSGDLVFVIGGPYGFSEAVYA